MPNRTKQVVARKGPMPATTVSTIDARLKKASDFVVESKETILRAPTARMPMTVAISVFCVLKRMEAAIHRRLNPVRDRVDEIMSLKFPDMKPGEREQRLAAGPFAIFLRNDAWDRKEPNPEKVMELLAKRHIARGEVFITPPPPPPFISAERLQALVNQGKISMKEYEEVMDLARPQKSLQVDVPKLIDKVVESRLLGGINQVALK